jgi:hypothetical protein
MSKPILTQSRLRELLDYNPETGVFTWKVSTSNRIRAGQKAGATGQSGYQSIQIDRKLYLLHRLAWLYQTGSWPQKYIDHKDGDKTNNKYANLRDVTHSQNLQNQKIRFSFSGTFPHGPKYRAKITVDKTVHLLGTFPTVEEAHAAYLTAKHQFHGIYAR